MAELMRFCALAELCSMVLAAWEEAASSVEAARVAALLVAAVASFTAWGVEGVWWSGRGEEEEG